MTRSVPVGELRPLGDRAFLIGVEDPAAGRALAAALRRRFAGTGAAPHGAADERLRGLDVVGGYATVLVALTDSATELGPVRSAAESVLADFSAGTDPSNHPGTRRTVDVAGRLVVIPCVFDGPDLDEVARIAGCGPDAVVAQLTTATLSVAVLGFAPGFAYLDGLPEALRAVPRRAHPRPRVPPGSVALANGHAAVYPTASPGGWQLVGRTSVPLFSPLAPPYAVLAPGDRVEFRVAGPDERGEPVRVSDPSWVPPNGARAVLEVVTPGLRAVLQDGGRPGVAAAGVPWAGPADHVSLILANRLVGNPDDAAALEITAGGTKLRGLGPSHLAVVGAAPEVRVDGNPGGAGRVTPLGIGQLLEIGPLRGGCRTYVAVAGGLLGPRVFESVASDELSGLGAGALGAGQWLYAGPWSPPLGDHLAEAGTDATEPGAVVELRVVAGPHPEAFTAGALEALSRCAFVVDDASNRVGIRLRAEDGAPVPRPLEGAGGELDSHGVVTGVVQVPPGGQPVVLLPDHATLGGYPVLAVVAAADHGRLGQCAPGTRVRLVPIAMDEALAAWHALRRALDGAVIGHYPLAAG